MGMDFVSAEIHTTINHSVTIDPEAVLMGMDFVGAELKISLISLSIDPEAVQMGMTFISGEFA